MIYRRGGPEGADEGPKMRKPRRPQGRRDRASGPEEVEVAASPLASSEEELVVVTDTQTKREISEDELEGLAVWPRAREMFVGATLAGALLLAIWNMTTEEFEQPLVAYAIIGLLVAGLLGWMRRKIA